jgi:uncharacterized cofD-like protein
VLPATGVKVSLVAEHADGTKTTGESLLGRMQKPIARLLLRPEDVAAGPDVIEAIEQAELVVLGPGSLYTSVLPNLLIRDIRSALLRTQALVGYVCNVMTQAGETQDFNASRHARVLIDHAGAEMLDFVLVNTGTVPARLTQAYAAEGSIPVALDEGLKQLPPNIRVLQADLVNTDNYVRHHSVKLAEALINALRDLKRR